ncbi:hypothetical protein HDU67_005726 [Dinochytrium kinnereticum]|nr:hypothetical protein HDU67_005726 [Dinochytrium kinnereticum]
MIASFAVAAAAVAVLAAPASAQIDYPAQIVSILPGLPECAATCYPAYPINTVEVPIFCYNFRQDADSPIELCFARQCTVGADLEKGKTIYDTVKTACANSPTGPLVALERTGTVTEVSTTSGLAAATGSAVSNSAPAGVTTSATVAVSTTAVITSPATTSKPSSAKSLSTGIFAAVFGVSAVIVAGLF